MPNHVDTIHIIDALVSNGFRINSNLLHILAQTKILSQADTEDNDFLPFIQEEANPFVQTESLDWNINAHTMMPIENQYKYLLLKIEENDAIGEWLPTTSNEQPTILRDLFQHIVQVHNTAIRLQLDLVAKFLDLMLLILEEGRINLHHILITTGSLEEILLLCNSFDDIVRTKAFQLLYCLSKTENMKPCNVKNLTQSREIGLIISASYLSNYQVSEWVGTLQKHTFETVVLPLEVKEALAITKSFEAYSFGRDSMVEENHKIALHGEENSQIFQRSFL